MLQGSESLLLSELETSVLTLAVALFVGRTFRAGLIEDSDFVSTELRILLLFEEEEPGLELLCTLLDFLVADGIDVDFSGISSSSSEESKRLLRFDGFLANVCLDGFELGLCDGKKNIIKVVEKNSKLKKKKKNCGD